MSHDVSLFFFFLFLFFLNSVCSQYYSAHAAYCNKLAQLLCSSYLHQELQKEGSSVSSWAVDPGMVDTALYRHLWTGLWLPQRKIAYLLFRVRQRYTVYFPHFLYHFTKHYKNGMILNDSRRQKNRNFVNDFPVKMWRRQEEARCGRFYNETKN